MPDMTTEQAYALAAQARDNGKPVPKDAMSVILADQARQPLTLEEAKDLDAKARALGKPTPRVAMAVLLAHLADRYRDLERERLEVYDRLREYTLRSHYKQDDEGRGLPERHPDRFSLNKLVETTRFHRTTMVHWMEDLILGPMIRVKGMPQRDTSRARPDLIPTYDLTDEEDAVSGAAG
jgi:hypothetical protein